MLPTNENIFGHFLKIFLIKLENILSQDLKIFLIKLENILNQDFEAKPQKAWWL